MIKAFLKQILDMGSVILSLLYAHYTIDNKKPSINGTLRYWDQTAIKYVPVSTWTMVDEGLKRVEIVGADDKRQITCLFAITPLGDFLAP